MYPISLSTSEELRLRLAAAATTNPAFVCTYADSDPEAVVTNTGTLNGTTPVVAAGSPSAGRRIIRQLVVQNPNAADITLILAINTIDFCRFTLSQLETFTLNGIYDQYGSLKTGVTGPQGIQGPAGPQGPPGTGITWRGAWNSTTQYAANDAVQYNGSSWIANTSNTNKTPGIDPEWDLWVAAGLSAPTELVEVAQTGNYTLQLSDALKFVTINSSSAATLTIPANATVAFPVGTQILVGRKGTGAVTISPASGVTVNDATSSVTLGDRWRGVVTLWKYGTNDWWVFGGLA